ncbi:hypothetical protein E2C01_035096 [Portunus trituberculatus]|uniref:Uncharacterized protein n=1 Tax=Portunus trituberculatus TaxID=210409 RepID=A0A5B7F8T8_PORTR|nr:hypothetical protein [Portunus trituberculatus]
MFSCCVHEPHCISSECGKCLLLMCFVPVCVCPSAAQLDVHRREESGGKLEKENLYVENKSVLKYELGNQSHQSINYPSFVSLYMVTWGTVRGSSSRTLRPDLTGDCLAWTRTNCSASCCRIPVTLVAHNTSDLA